MFGFGPGTYAFEYARFQKPENITIISTNFGDGGNAHSEYLGPLSEMGVLGLLTTLLLIGTIFYKGITLYNRWGEGDRELANWYPDSDAKWLVVKVAKNDIVNLFGKVKFPKCIVKIKLIIYISMISHTTYMM